jgi:2-polyprenyl-3-methyl-5-hydroxy-6-metoxy-1,4-benzoquinol methylase
MMNNLSSDHIFVSCPLCGRDNPKTIYNKSGRGIVRCKECKFMYQNPRSLNLVGRGHKEDYYRKEYLNTATPHKKFFEEKFNAFLSNRRPGTVLDVGCATGQFLEVARKKGWQAVGIDVSEWVCNYLINKGFTDIHNCTLEEAGFPNEMFDAVNMNHVLEHIPLPLKFFVEVHRILKPGGLIMIEVPNEFYFPYNYSLINMLMPSHLPPRKSPASHLSLFTRNTLFKVLKSSGFTVVTVRTEGFANKYRTSTPTFKQKTLIIKLALLMCRLHIDTFLGLGRYLVAVACKN